MSSKRKPRRTAKHDVSEELFNLIKVTEFDLQLGEESFRIRVELTQSHLERRRFRANVWRAEVYRIQSTFPQNSGRPQHEPSDELVWVNWNEILRTCNKVFVSPSVARAGEAVFNELYAWIRHTRGECDSKPHVWGECPDSKELTTRR